MKRYIKSSKQFYGSNGEVITIERETKSLIYDYSFDGDYYKGQDHIFVKFKDANGNVYLISKINDNKVINPNNPYNLEEGKQYQVSGYYYPESNWGNSLIQYTIVQPRIAGITTQNKSNGIEVVTKYFYPADAVEDAEKLCKLFDQNGIEYKYYGQNFDEDDGTPFPLQFTVLRSNKTWKDIQRLVNSIRYAKPKQEKLKVVRESNGELWFREWI